MGERRDGIRKCGRGQPRPRPLSAGVGSQEFLPAAISVGTNPQFQGTVRTVEAHVLGRADLDLYDERVTVVFVKRIRPMMVFDSIDQLLARMDDDLRATAAILGARSASRIDPGRVTAGI